jgi:uncharacterized membrane protein YecN with MAPEG domain
VQPPLVAALYAGLAALLLAALTANAARARGAARVAFGDGGDPALLRAIRAQGNAAETLPAALLVIALSELIGAPGWVVHLMGAALIAGRVLHAAHCLAAPRTLGLRVAGMALTLSVLGLGGLGLVGHALAEGAA